MVRQFLYAAFADPISPRSSRRSDETLAAIAAKAQPNGDFATTMVRQFLYAAFARPYFAALARSSDATLAAIAAKAEKEMAYHLRHAGEWVIRLGDGTAESHARAQAALDDLAIYVDEFFEVDAVERSLIEEGVAPDPARNPGRVRRDARSSVRRSRH